jgi:hypothetical protein
MIDCVKSVKNISLLKTIVNEKFSCSEEQPDDQEKEVESI